MYKSYRGGTLLKPVMPAFCCWYCLFEHTSLPFLLPFLNQIPFFSSAALLTFSSALATGSLASPFKHAGFYPSVASAFLYSVVPWSFPGGSDGKESVCNAGDPGSIPGSGKSPGEGSSYALQYFCLENSMTEAFGRLQSGWGVPKSWTRMSDQHFHLHFFSLKLLLFLSASFYFLPRNLEVEGSGDWPGLEVQRKIKWRGSVQADSWGLRPEAE